MSGPNLNKLPKINDKQISSERLLSLVKARSLDFRIDSPGRFGSSSLSDLGIEDLRLTVEDLIEDQTFVPRTRPRGILARVYPDSRFRGNDRGARMTLVVMG